MGRGVVGGSRSGETSKCTGVNWYIITYVISKGLKNKKNSPILTDERADRYLYYEKE